MSEEPTRGRVLVVDDDPTIRMVLRETLEDEGHTVLDAETARGALEQATAEPVDAVVLDIRLPDDSGLKVLDRLQEAYPDLPVVMITGEGGRELGLESVERGAYDFFSKPFSNAELRVVVERALERQRLARELEEARRSQLDRVTYDRLVGQSAAMREIFRNVDRVVRTDIPVLIEGESGTGKELVADAIHRRSRREDGPMVKLNCIAIPDGLLESELFGHEKGAFTGADEKKTGKFEQADGGTLFLDEIGDMAPELQGKLLRVLQQQEFERVGGKDTISVDVRIVAATNKRLKREMDEGRFREDLYYRLNVFSIRLPALRDRRADIPYLVQALLDEVRERHKLEVRGVSAAALARMLHYDWPGNVRELKNCLQSAAVRAEEGVIRVAHLPDAIAATEPDRSPPTGVVAFGSGEIPGAGAAEELADAEGEAEGAEGKDPDSEEEEGAGEASARAEEEDEASGGEEAPEAGAAAGDGAGPGEGAESIDDVLASVEELMIRRALEETSGVQARAAEQLGIQERSLWYRVKKYDIDAGEYQAEKDRAGEG